MLHLIDEDGMAIKWRAIVAFTQASVRYPVLGICGCLEFFSARFLGDDRIVELEPNDSCPIM